MARNTRRLQVRRQEDVAPRNRQPMSREETRRERTLRLGPQRLANAVKAIQHAGQLANTTTYDVRGNEPEKIVGTLRAAVDAIEYELKNPGRKATPLGVFDPEAE